ncbi:MAG: hypothetical protein OXP09_18710 [Gammaproteobacteria bacterium]|nr:hypothetical protein [Rhodospirillaceae bacterium]MDE0367595.1 hypothetical protein [Gammaproteobacteria bacterium]
MWRTVGKIVWGAASAFSMLLGVAGWSDDSRVWLKWLQVVPPQVYGILVGAGLIGLIVLLAPALRHRVFGDGESIDVGSNEWEGVSELRGCNDALVVYAAVPARRPTSEEQIAASDELRPYLKRALVVLDREKIPHPDFDTDAMVIDDILRWSNFLSQILAHSDDLEAARRAGKEFMNEQAE